MSTHDKYPERIEFEFDRPQLARYWRIQALLGCCLSLAMVGAFMGTAVTSGRVQKLGMYDFWRIVLMYIQNVAIATAVGFLIGLVLYYVGFHRQSKRRAANLRLIVEGPYLRLISGAVYISDRRIHFRSLCDYSTHEGPLLKWLGMKVLSFQVVGGPRTISNMVPGLVDPSGVRDLLCEIDAAREN